MGLFTRHRRAKLRAQPLADEAWATIDKNVPYARTLDAGTRAELAGLVQVFLAEKHFEGCGGLELTPEIQLTIAAQACVLLLHRESDVYPTIDTVLVYPHAYRTPPAPQLVFARSPSVVGQEARSGEMSWKQGIVVLAWDHVRTETHVVGDGQNLVMHEFAHALDAEDGAMDGAPPLDTRERYQRWALVLGDELDAMSRRLEDGLETDIRPYGATNAREFFAVVTEKFFEDARELKLAHPRLYAELKEFYKQDPASVAADAAQPGPRAD
jgi:Mlc titration factor MtfA (ptsG expression regulator)